MERGVFVQGFYENHRDDMAHVSAGYRENDHCVPHFHRSVELTYVLEGALEATLDGVCHTVPAGTLLIVSSYVVHAYATPRYSRSVVTIIPGSEVPSARALMEQKAFAAPLCPDDAQGTLRMLLCMLAGEGMRNPLTSKGICYAVLGLLTERVGLVEARPGGHAGFIRNVLDYFQAHHTEPLFVQRAAEHFGYSRSRFSHLFNRRLGCSIPEYVASLRCRHAAQLLRETDLPVSDVALAAGFESQRTFYRAFRKQYDMTPQRYAAADFGEK